MNKLRIAVVDDDDTAREVIKYHISKTENLELVYEFNNPVDAAQLFSRNELDKNIDLAILDIEMPDINGLQLSKAIGNKIYKGKNQTSKNNKHKLCEKCTVYKGFSGF